MYKATGAVVRAWDDRALRDCLARRETLPKVGVAGSNPVVRSNPAVIPTGNDSVRS